MKLRLDTIRRLMDREHIDTQVKLAALTGLSEATVSRILSGFHQGVHDMHVQKLAAVLNCKEGEIVELEDVAQTDEERKLLTDFRAASGKARRMALLALDPSE